MVFNKSIFKGQYGAVYIVCIKLLLITLAAIVFFLVILLFTAIKIPYVLGILLGTVFLFSLFPILPLLLCYYWKALKTSQRQKQWIDNGTIHVLIVPENGFVWGAIVAHTKEYTFKSIEHVKISKRYIEITSTIHLVDIYNNAIKEKDISFLKIPRNFLNEEKIIYYGGK